jgi:O-acetyl-ADP-ribose deacetylase (regulator of RNase III)
MSEKSSSVSLPNEGQLEIIQGDLTLEKTDAIINAANNRLQHGGGVAGAIVRRGGSVIQQESDKWIKENGPVDHSKPAVTGAGKLESKFVIHAVGPVWGEGKEDKKLEVAVEGCLSTADKLGINSIAFPALSTGIFGFPKDRAAHIIFQTIWNYFSSHQDSQIRLVRVVLYDQNTLNSFLKVFNEWQQKRAPRT